MTALPITPRPLLSLPAGTTVLVAGFGRCGSSLTMQMLDRGGCPVVGRYPAYEELDGAMPVEDPAGWLAAVDGKAVKALDPHRWRLPPGPAYRCIWLDRDPKQQARSALKMAATELPGIEGDKVALGRLARSYGADRPRVKAHLRSLGADILTVRFEKLLADPFAEARRIADHVGLPLDVGGMSRMVVDRAPGCFPGFLEKQLVALAKAVGA